MGKILKIMLPLSLLGLLPILSGCLTKEKTIQIVVSEKTTAEYIHISQSKSFSSFMIIDFAAQLDDVLSDEDVDRSDIVHAVVTSLTYGVTQFSHSHDWDISGQVMVGRDDIPIGPDTLVTYTRQSVQDALGQKIPARLHADGVGVINQALQQYIAGTHSPRLVFIVQNGDVDPEPSALDKIQFTWKTWLEIHVIIEKTLDVPDPF